MTSSEQRRIGLWITLKAQKHDSVWFRTCISSSKRRRKKDYFTSINLPKDYRDIFCVDIMQPIWKTEMVWWSNFFYLVYCIGLVLFLAPSYFLSRTRIPSLSISTATSPTPACQYDRNCRKNGDPVCDDGDIFLLVVTISVQQYSKGEWL